MKPFRGFPSSARWGGRYAAMSRVGLLILAVRMSVHAQAPAEFAWVNHFAGSGPDDRARWMTADREGNVLVTGEFSGTLRVDERSMTSRGALDAFIVKLDR